jgi:hypothetical protein
MNVHHDDNHEPIQLFNKAISAKQPSQYATLGYYLHRIGAPTPIATSIGFQNQPLFININLVPINLEVERLQLLNKFEQLHQVD